MVSGRPGRGSDGIDGGAATPAATTIAKARVLVVGSGWGPLLRLRAPISFWGGVDPVSGRIADPRHPDYGAALGGTVLVVPATVGSSSSSAIMLELIREGTAPAAVLMGRADAILALGVVVARELGHSGPPVLELPVPVLETLPQGVLEVLEDGTLRRVE